MLTTAFFSVFVINIYLFDGEKVVSLDESVELRYSKYYNWMAAVKTIASFAATYIIILRLNDETGNKFIKKRSAA